MDEHHGDGGGLSDQIRSDQINFSLSLDEASVKSRAVVRRGDPNSRRKREREALREFNGTLRSPRAGVRGRARTRERQVHARGCKSTARVRHGGHGGRSGGGRSGHDGRSGGGRSGHDGRSGGGGEEASSSSSSSTAIPAMSSTGTSRSTVQRVAASMRVFDEFRNSTPRALEG